MSFSKKLVLSQISDLIKSIHILCDIDYVKMKLLTWNFQRRYSRGHSRSKVAEKKQKKRNLQVYPRIIEKEYTNFKNTFLELDLRQWQSNDRAQHKQMKICKFLWWNCWRMSCLPKAHSKPNLEARRSYLLGAFLTPQSNQVLSRGSSSRARSDSSALPLIQDWHT